MPNGSADTADSDRRLADAEGIETLYKFRRYASPEDRRFVHEILVDHKIYFARASVLNDERDLRPLLRFRGSSEAETQQLLQADAERVWERRRPPYSAEQLHALRTRLKLSTLEQLKVGAIQRVHRRLEDYYWVFSLAASRDYVAMWDEYADHGRGLCIHFRSDARSPFGAAQRVLYQSQMPVLLVPLGTQREVADVSTLTKTLRWQQEREYRLVRYPDLDYPGLTFDGQHAYFPASAISGITIGLDMAAAEQAQILKVAEAHTPPLPVWRPAVAI